MADYGSTIGVTVVGGREGAKRRSSNVEWKEQCGGEVRRHRHPF